MLQSIFNTIPQRVFWRDLSGRYLGCNKAFASDAGLDSPEQIAGKVDAELPWIYRSPQFLANTDSVTQTGKPVMNAEFQMTTSEGQQCWFQASSLPLRDSQQRLFGTLGVYEDITKRKKTEDAIKRSNAALSDFAHVVSHDLQSPVRSARTYMHLVLKRYDDQFDEGPRALLRDAEASLAYMQELIQSLLKYATATEPDPSGEMPVSLEVSIEQAVANLRPIIDESQAAITHDSLPVLRAHPAQLVQVFENLISNAIKYRKRDLTPAIHVSAIGKPEEWVIAVRDNGIGIAKEDQQRIFNPLKRLHGREIPGFGIGLATCRNVVEHHGGRMWVESKAGGGSTFCFTVRKDTPAGHGIDELPSARSSAAITA
jgi:PAS domain S-box-containing protein